MKIDWKLKNFDEVVIDKKDVDAILDKNVIYYTDEYGTHVVDCDNKIYERRAEYDIFRVDFNKSLLTVIFNDNKLKYDIVTKYEDIKNKLILSYDLGNEKKVIEITRKEEL